MFLLFFTLLGLCVIAACLVVYIYFVREQKEPMEIEKRGLDAGFQKEQIWIRRLEGYLYKYLLLPATTKAGRFAILAVTFVIALLLTPLAVGASYGLFDIYYMYMVLILFSPVSLPMFPGGLMAVLTNTYDPYVVYNSSPFTGWFIYFVTLILGVFMKKRSLFMFVYFVFISLLIMNIVGCAKTTPEFLSGIN